MSPVAQLLRQAVRQQRAGALVEAGALYEQILAVDPHNVDALTNAGVLCARSGRLEEAEAHYRRALTMSPSDADVLTNLGNLLRQRGDLGGAQESYRAALAVNPGHAIAGAGLVDILFATSRTEAAVIAGQAVLAVNPAANGVRLQFAYALYSADKIHAAAALAGEALTVDPCDSRVHDLLGHINARLQDYAAAERHWRAAVAADPSWPEPLRCLGILLGERGDPVEAEAVLRRAIALKPEPATFAALGSFLRARRPAEARPWLEKAFAGDGENAEVAMDLGNLHYAAERYALALPCFERARALNPGNLEPAYNLALALDWVGRTVEAQEILEGLAAAHPRRDDVQSALGHMLYRRGLTDRALQCYDAAIALNPGRINLLAQKARVLVELGRPSDAIALCEKVLQERPNEFYALKVYGQALSEVGRHADAIAAVQAALTQSKATDTNTLAVLAGVCERAKRREDALRAYELILRVAPNDARTIARVAELKLTICQWDRYDLFIEGVNDAIQASIRDKTPMPFCIQDLQNVPLSWPTLAGAAKRRAEEIEAKAAPLRAKSPFNFDGKLARWRAGERRRLRVGYALPYTFMHSFPFLMKSITERHDRSRFETFGYAVRPGTTAFDVAYRATFEHFKDLPSAAPDVAARMIRDDDLDVLIDVTGHTGIHCQDIMAMRPAPVSMHMLGYGITTGASYMDYLLSDNVWMRPELRPHVTENVVYMPDSWFIGFHGLRNPAFQPTRAGQALPEDAFVYCNFNQPFKFEPSMFSVWMRILRRVPHGVLWLGAWDDSTRRNLHREAEARGVDPARVVMAGIAPPAEHAVRLSLADLAVDSRYHAGGVTTIDALWAGVPIVTCPGHLPTSGNGLSLSHAHGVPEMAVTSLQEYEDQAVALALDPERYRALRRRVEDNRATAPLFDRERYVRHLERALELIWANTVNGTKADIHVPAE